MKSRLCEDKPEISRTEDDERVNESYEYMKMDDEKMTARRHFGIAAEELQKIYPDLVLEGQDGYLSVNYVELVPILIRSIQELKAELDELKGTDQLRQARSNEKSGTFEEDHTLYPISVNGQIIGKKRPVQK